MHDEYLAFKTGQNLIAIDSAGLSFMLPNVGNLIAVLPVNG